MAILLPKDDNDAGVLFLTCLSILIVIVFTLVIVIGTCGDTIVQIFNIPEIRNYLFLIPIGVFFDGLYIILRYWNTRKRRFGVQATTQALQSFSTSTFNFSAGILGFVNAGSLIIGQILGLGLGTLVLFYQTMKYDFLIFKSNFSRKKIIEQIIRYKKFPMYNIWAAFMNTISWQLPILMLTTFFSTSIAGLYALGLMMIQMPMNLIGTSISQVFLQHASVAKDNDRLSTLVEDTCSILLIISILPFILLSLIGGDLFAIVFGSQWKDAGIFVQILAPWALIWFITSPLTTISIVLEKQEINLIYNIIILITRLISLLIGGLFGNVYLALFLFMISGVLVYGGICYLCVIVWAKSSMNTIWKQIKNPILISISLGIGALFVTYLPISTIFICGIVIMIGIFYILYLIKTQPLVRVYIGL